MASRDLSVTKKVLESNKSNKGIAQKYLLLVLVALGFGFLGGWIGAEANNNGALDIKNTTNEQKQQIISSESQLTSQIAKTSSPSVVSINVKGVQQSYFFGGYDYAAAGTGIILNEDGVIITNRHVVDQSVKEVSVTLSDGTELPAKVLDRDTLNDLAFIKVTDKKGAKLTPAKLGDSSKIEVGDKVIAIGNALGEFGNSVTTGIISGKGRAIVASDGTATGDSLRNLLQTDAAINEGNSGGPLLNLNGEIIGINVAKTDGSSENIGFAIPINDAKVVITSILEQGRIIRPYVGVRYVNLNEAIAKRYSLKVSEGAYVAPSSNSSMLSVLGDSPAEKSGIKEGDVIVKINDDKLTEDVSLIDLVSKYSVGDTIKITINRDGSEKVIDVKLEEAPEN